MKRASDTVFAPRVAPAARRSILFDDKYTREDHDRFQKSAYMANAHIDAVPLYDKNTVITDDPEHTSIKKVEARIRGHDSTNIRVTPSKYGTHKGTHSNEIDHIHSQVLDRLINHYNDTSFGGGAHKNYKIIPANANAVLDLFTTMKGRGEARRVAGSLPTNLQPENEREVYKEVSKKFGPDIARLIGEYRPDTNPAISEPPVYLKLPNAHAVHAMNHPTFRNATIDFYRSYHPSKNVVDTSTTRFTLPAKSESWRPGRSGLMPSNSVHYPRTVRLTNEDEKEAADATRPV